MVKIRGEEGVEGMWRSPKLPARNLMVHTCMRQKEWRLSRRGFWVFVREYLEK